MKIYLCGNTLDFLYNKSNVVIWYSTVECKFVKGLVAEDYRNIYECL